jgi:acetate---CoA ligase (ADP-forming)
MTDRNGAAAAGPARDRLTRLLDPRSIAVFGASADPAKRGHQVLLALRDAGYPHPVHPINPKGGQILGIPVARSIQEVPGPVDAVLVATAAATVPGILREAAAAGVAGAVVLANGFGESGAQGSSLEQELREVAAETGIRVVGPNTSGILNLARGVNLVGVADVPRGPVSVITQSGNMLLSLVADCRAVGGPGFDVYVGLGNQADVRCDECLAFLADHETTRAIAVHCEGLRDGRAFLGAAARATRSRPVVLLSGGTSEAGRRTALSHTGSVAGRARVTTAALRQAGVEVVTRSDELAVVAGVLAATPLPRRGGLAVLSDGGGHAVLAADALAALGVRLATLAPRTEERLRAVLGANAAVANPVDVAGATDTRPDLFADCAEALMADEEVGMVLVVGLFGGYHLRFDEGLRSGEEETAKALVRLCDRSGIPVLVQSCYATARPSTHEVLRGGGIQVVASIDHAARATAALFRRADYLATAKERLDPSRHQVPARAADATAARLLTEPEARALLGRSGIYTGPWWLVTSPEDAARTAARLARPFALKVVSRQIAHKSEVGGVRLNVTAEDAADQYRQMLAEVAAALPGAVVDGALVAPMARRGVELLVGVTRDPVFGPVVAFGSGGALVEAVRDVAFRAAPLTNLEAREMIEETEATRLLDGFRGLPPVDRDSLADLLVRTGLLAARTPGLRELDLNPVVAAGREILPVDVRIVMDEEKR